MRVGRANLTTGFTLVALSPMDVSGEFWGRVDTWAGPTFGIVLFLVGAFLMFKGARSIKLLSFATGCAIGQLTSALLYSNVSDFVPLSEGDFTLAAIFGCGVILFMAVSLMSLAVTAYISLHIMLWIVAMVETQGYDVGTGSVGGILVGISWLVNRYLRRNLYLFGSAVLGSLIVIYGYLVMNGDIPSEISIMDPNIQLIGLVLFLNSVMIQRKGTKDFDIRKEEADMQKKIAKRQRIENDKHGRGIYLEPDILTQAAIQERQDSYGQNYNLNRQN